MVRAAAIAISLSLAATAADANPAVLFDLPCVSAPIGYDGLRSRLETRFGEKLVLSTIVGDTDILQVYGKPRGTSTVIMVNAATGQDMRLLLGSLV